MSGHSQSLRTRVKRYLDPEKTSGKKNRRPCGHRLRTDNLSGKRHTYRIQGNLPISTLYSSVAQFIIRDIKSAHFPVGSMLPSEPELAARYGVSRSTIRAALERLQAAGFINRRRGAGTRVQSDRAGLRYTHSMIAVNDLMQFAGDSYRELMVVEDIVADEELAKKLDNRPGKNWIRMGQLRWVEGDALPVCWTDLYLDTRFRGICDKVDSYPGLVYNLIEENYDVYVQEISQTIEATGVPIDIAKYIDAVPKSHALQLTRYYLDTDQKPLFITISILPSDRYASRITLARAP